MTDLFTHVLLAYVTVVSLSWRFDRIDERYAPVAMVGAVVPDLSKIHLVVGHQQVSALLGVPFSWLALHRLGGALLVVAMAVLLFGRDERRPAAGFLLFGTGSHFLLDALIERAHGLSPPYLYPLSWWHPPAGNVYLSSDLWPSLIAVVLAAIVWYVDRVRGSDV